MVAFSPHTDNILAVAHEDGTVQLWEVMLSSSKVILTVPARPETCFFSPNNVTLTWSSDGSRIALSGWHDSIDLYHSRESDNYSGTVLRGHEGSVEQTAFTSNSQLLISRSEDTVQAWNAETATWRVIYKATGLGHLGAMAVLPGEGDYVLVSSNEGESPRVAYECREADDLN